MTPVSFPTSISFPDKLSSPKQNLSYLVSSQALRSQSTAGISRSFRKSPIVAKIRPLRSHVATGSKARVPGDVGHREGLMPCQGHAPMGTEQGTHFQEAAAMNTLSSSSFHLRLCTTLIPLGPKWKSPHPVPGLAEMPPPPLLCSEWPPSGHPEGLMLAGLRRGEAGP